MEEEVKQQLQLELELEFKRMEEEKKARRLSFLVNMHIAEETLITRCLKPQNN